ncbi:redoxin domain-containing protein [Proteobacteria bacterium 005FR1]|nr:redoxin domain-containing protein [Proteobacteria bacterium 005FR1]
MINARNMILAFGAALVSSAVLATPSMTGADKPQKIGDFALIDHQGDFVKISRQRFNKALVIFSQANDCRSADAQVAELRKLREQWQGKDVAFFMMNSVADQDRASLIKTAQAKSIDFPILDDSSQLIAEKLGITKAGQVVVLDPEQMTINYRGPVDSQLSSTLKNIVAGSPAGMTEVAVKQGCDIKFPAKMAHEKSVPDYASEVAPVIEKNCAYCHREGGIGPFPMNNHMIVKGFGPMIKEVLLTKRMPPMQVDPHFNHFTNANYLSDEELQTLVHWIDAGAPRGKSAEDPLTQIKQADLRAWQLGEPDAVVKMPKHDVPATGVLDYINTTVALEFGEDKWIKAVQFIPGDPAVLHHLLTYVVAPTEGFVPGQEVDGDIGEAPPPPRRGNGPASGLNSRKFLEGYAPGKVEAMTFPKGTGVFVPKGYHLAAQFHYTTNGKATEDETLLGVWFYDKGEEPKDEYLNTAVATQFTIPPNALDHPAKASHVFDKAIMLYGLRPHMHFRGKEMKFTAKLPDGSTKVLMNVPDYSYNWQPTFALEEPIYLPAGTEVTVSGAFDNSKYNPANPDPSKELTFGLQTWDEMFIGYFSYAIVDDKKEVARK